jgi:DNA-binding beta-propeller fold protein YncE
VLRTPDPDTSQGYVVPIHVATNAIGRPVNVGTLPVEIAITPDGKIAYVVVSDPFAASGSVVPIHTGTNTAGLPIRTGRFPFDIAIAPQAG